MPFRALPARAAAAACGGARRAAASPAPAPLARAAAAAPARRRRPAPFRPRAHTLVEEVATVATPTGPMRTLLLRPSAPGRFPGLVLYSEIFQVTGPIVRSAQILAGHGFVVAVPDIYHEYAEPGEAFSYVGAEGVARGNALKVTKPCSAYDSDSAASVAALAAHPACTGAVGATGFCVGGHLSFRAALTNPDVRSAACFYATDVHKGSLGAGGDDSLALIPNLAKNSAEVLMIWGRQDPHVPAEGRSKVMAALSSAGVAFSWHEVNGAHAFMRDEGSAGRYDAELALWAYSMVVAFFRRTLTAEKGAGAGEGAGAPAAAAAVSTH